MNAYEHVERLKRRARRFLAHAHTALRDGDFDIACFCAEQAAQPRLKALFLRMVGYVPRTHDVRELLGDLVSALKALGRGELASHIATFSRDNRDVLRRLDEAYTGARYLPHEFDEEDARACVEVAEMLINMLNEIEDDAFAERGGLA